MIRTFLEYRGSVHLHNRLLGVLVLLTVAHGEGMRDEPLWTFDSKESVIGGESDAAGREKDSFGLAVEASCHDPGDWRIITT